MVNCCHNEYCCPDIINFCGVYLFLMYFKFNFISFVDYRIIFFKTSEVKKKKKVNYKKLHFTIEIEINYLEKKKEKK